jgi:hypothetical protein
MRAVYTPCCLQFYSLVVRTTPGKVDGVLEHLSSVFDFRFAFYGIQANINARDRRVLFFSH